MIGGQTHHMCLVHLLYKEGMEQYTEFYDKIGHDPDKLLIMDNGVIEGDQFLISNICDVAETIGASEIILTDKLKDAIGTFDSVAADISYIHQRYTDHRRKVPFGLMVVPQGNSLQEWVDNAELLVSSFPDYISTIGVPKHLVETCGMRDARIQAIAQLAARINTADYNFHLLGCWTNPLEVLAIAKASADCKIPMVRSCDSIIAYKYAEENQLFWDGDRPNSNPVDFENDYTENIEALGTNIISWTAMGDPINPKNTVFITGPTVAGEIHDDLLYSVELLGDLVVAANNNQSSRCISLARQIQRILSSHMKKED